jgi:hypothetical protein
MKIPDGLWITGSEEVKWEAYGNDYLKQALHGNLLAKLLRSTGNGVDSTAI